MKSVKGKLTNKETSEALAFSINPTDYKLSRSFEYNIEPCIGQPVSLVSFRTGNISSLTFQLAFEKDADAEADLKKVTAFVRGLNKIEEAKKSVPLVEFSLGTFNFKGYVASVTTYVHRFDNQGEPCGLKLDFSLLSNGDYENGK